MLNSRRVCKCLLLATVAPLLIVPAMAQTTGAPGPAQGGSGSTLPSTGTSGSHPQIADIVVTARKKSENVQKVPAQVDVIGQKELQELHVTQLTDIAAYVPGLQVNSAGTPGQTTVSLRGIAPLGPAPTVGSYINDSPVGATSVNAEGSLHSLDLLPYDVQRIEVLQGPQGTLYGANSIGGLIKYELVDPSLTRYKENLGVDAFGIANAGSPGGGGRASISGPLIQNKLGFLVSYGSENTPGYIDNAQTGQKGQNSYRQQTARFALLFQPNEDLSIKLNALFQRINADGNATVPLDPVTLKPIDGDLNDNNYMGQPSKNVLNFYSAEVNWDLGWAHLVSASSYSVTKFTSVQDLTREYPLFPLLGLPTGIVPFDGDLNTKKVTQEIRLSSPTTNRLEWLIGGFYTREDTQNDQDIFIKTANGASLPPFDPLLVAKLRDSYREFAAFGDLTYHITSKFDVAGGLRYAANDQTYPVTSAGYETGNAFLDGSSSENVVTYSVAPRYQITDNVLSYVRIASGYQAGGPNIPYPGVPKTVKSDTLTDYEAGLKTTFWNKHALLDIAGFYINWKNIQIQAFQPGTGFTFLDNGGRAKSAGVSANGVVEPISGLTLSGNITYTNATLTEDAPQIFGRSGDQLPYIPTLSGAFQAGYGWRPAELLSAHVGLGVRAVGQRFSAVQSSPTSYTLSSYAALDLDASLTFKQYTARLFVKNATNTRAYSDDTVIQNALSGATEQVESTVIQPLTIGLSVDASF